jgi:hypothetical protein
MTFFSSLIFYGFPELHILCKKKPQRHYGFSICLHAFVSLWLIGLPLGKDFDW